MTDEQLAAMHRLLAEYHRNLAKEALLDVVQQYHADLGQRLVDEAAQIPRRTAILQRLREREHRSQNVLETPKAGARSATEVRNYRNIDADGVAKTETDHDGYCPVCRAYFDRRDLSQMLAHIHDQEIEIGEGEGPPPRGGITQLR
jgi:hypothetical protein